jgi:serine/threonine protein kinase/tetratricopeptide (TPR) repeat protein
MKHLLRCPLGHDWESESVDPDRDRCPVCGATAAIVEEQDAHTVNEDAASPSTDQSGALQTAATLDGGATVGFDGSAKAPEVSDRTDIEQPGLKSPDASTAATLAVDGCPSAQNDDDRTGACFEAQAASGPDDANGAWESSPQHAATLDSTAPTRKVGVPGKSTDEKAPKAATKARGKRKAEIKMPTKVAGYYIIGELGRGGMGVVYKARQVGLNRLCALKMILGSGHASLDTLARFRIEAEAIAQLQHPNIVQVYEIGEQDDCPFFSLEFVEGDSLAHKIDGTPQPVREAAQLMQSLCAGMQAAHQRGIIHRDLKPANILLTKDGVPKITDFGLAKRFEDQDQGQTRTGAIMGTPSYMAPEQAKGRNKELGPAADIYSLGAILYDLLTGRPPFRGETIMDTLNQVQNLEPLPPVRLQPKVPLDLQTICLKALNKDPKKRYESAGALGEDLRRFLAGEPILARPASPVERSIKWIKRHPAATTLISISSLAVVSVLTFGVLWLNAERQAAIDREEQQTRLAQTETAGRLEAERLKEIADKQRSRAEALKEIADKQRDRAEANFELAQDAVNQMLTRVASANLVNEPRMEAVRRDLLEKALAFNLNFLEQQQSDTGLRYETAAAFHRVADIYRSLGRLDDADKNYQSAIARFKELSRAQPENEKYRKELAAGTMERGLVLQLLSHDTDSEKTYLEAIDLFDKLGKDFPQETLYQEDLSNLQQNLANLYAAAGRLEAAEKGYDKALAIRKALDGKLGKEASHRQRLARVEEGRGAVLWLIGKNTDAELSLVSARDTFAQLIKQVPDYPDYMADAANASLNLGLFYRKTNRGGQALAALEQAIQWYQALTAKYPLTLTYRQKLAHVTYELGMLYGAGKRLPEAYAELGKALQLQKALPADYAATTPVRLQTAQCEISLGIACVALNKLPEAVSHYQAGIDLLEPLKPSAKTAPEVCKELCRGHFNLAELYRGMKRPLEAQRSWDRLLQLREDLVQSNPKSAENHVELALVQEDFAIRFLQGDKFGEARKFALASAGQWTEALTLLPQDTGVQQHLFDVQLLLAKAELGTDHHTAAAKALAETSKLPGQHQLVAALYCKCMMLASKDEMLKDEQRKQAVQEYGDAALAALQAAVKQGFKDVAFLKTSPEFKVLRTRPEFTRLVTELEKQTTGPKSE